MSGVKTTLLANPVTSQHQSAAQQRGVNASGLLGAFQEAVTELIYFAKQVILTLPQGTLVASGTISTSSANVPIVGIIPPFVVPGLQVTDLNTGQVLGLVSHGAGSSTLVLAANSAFAGQGASDSIQVADSNLPVLNSIVAALS